MQMLFQLSYRPAAVIVTNRGEAGSRTWSLCPERAAARTMAGVPIDLRADVGAGLHAADEAILPLMPSADIGCGGHAGDGRTMRTPVPLAIEHDVRWAAVAAEPT